MRNEIIQTDKTIEGAIEAACLKLGCTREDCEWEILDLPKRGFLGFKNTPAKVRVSIQMPDPPAQPAAAKPAPQPKQAPKPAEPKPQQQQRQPAPKPARAPAPKPEQPAAQPQAPAQAQTPAEPPTAENTAKGEIAAAYLRTVLSAANLNEEIIIDTTWEQESVCLKIQGEGVGQIIGRRGDTLDALQYLCSLVANRQGGDYLRITVDCGDYRLRRRATLEALAKKLSAQVLKTGHNKSLEPMNPFERRIIHSTVSEIEGVSSTSIGDEPNRRVLITMPGGSKPRREGPPRERSSAPPRTQPANRLERSTERPEWPDKGAKGDRPNEGENTTPGRRMSPGGRGGRGERDRDRRGGPGGRGDRRDRPPAYQPTKDKPDVPPTEAENKPLYGKINLD